MSAKAGSEVAVIEVGGEVELLAWQEDQDKAARFAAEAKAPATLKAYAADWLAWLDYCGRVGVDPATASGADVAGYLAALLDGGRKVSTVNRVASSLSVQYRARGRAGEANPVRTVPVEVVMAGARRSLGVAQKRARAVTVSEMARMSACTSAGPLGVRDRALILLGFAGAFRRSEIVALDVTDVAVVDQGLEVTVRKSKTDQEGAGAVVVIGRANDPANCPVRAWSAWLDVLGATEGPAFVSINRHGTMSGARLSDRAVSLVLARAAECAGVSTDRLSAHSLRAGFVTAATQAGHGEAAIMEVSRHRSLPVLRGYMREADRWKRSATALGW